MPLRYATRAGWYSPGPHVAYRAISCVMYGIVAKEVPTVIRQYVVWTVHS